MNHLLRNVDTEMNWFLYDNSLRHERVNICQYKHSKR